MKFREHLLIGVLILTAAYAVFVAASANHLRSELASLKVSHQKLQAQHSRMKACLLADRGAGDEAFRRVLAVLEAEDGVELILSSSQGTTRANSAPDHVGN